MRARIFAISLHGNTDKIAKMLFLDPSSSCLEGLRIHQGIFGDKGERENDLLW